MRCGTRPVISADRDGWQIGAEAWHCSNRWQVAANASTCGVAPSVEPIQPIESPFRSSAVISSRFKGSAPVAATAPDAIAASIAAARSIARVMIGLPVSR